MDTLTRPQSTPDANPASSPEQWREQGAILRLNDHNLFVMDQGDRGLPTLLLIHGFPTSSWDWQPVWNTLSKRYRLVSMDMLGFGFSDKPDPHHYSIHEQADLFEALIQTKQLGDFHVLAHDYGDTVAQELLARQLEGQGAGQWLSCCFLNGGLFPETHRALLTQKLLLSPLGKWVNKLAGYHKFRQSFSSVFGANSKPSEQELQAFWRIINTHNGKHIFHNLITYMRDRIEHRERWVTALQRSDIPLALINGASDPVSGQHMVARYQELNCRLDYLGQLPDIGHYPQVEDPAAVLEHYLCFLNQVAKES
ncbi:alpha/beta hydrolase [Aestuariirhabdus sp. Z084]|uniref:alpha/beta fold hydrolase n=1 Tax=Aestuariirhabdus haliotis TaxID=2918751 RepID=UPI00201B3ABD|nr:alpha/beta hydrolase [Aestuariirhabdus haliotis]MCL6416732.1 alpha/beta hydrolase [Aestuariirhabdus haliotis]MCL6420732.1 alpha/beta hydrolase [Aestuariirhabdus haliotis]